ncbi:MAG: hypothetical protein K2G07_07645 [Muribaculaceae bacterium]|nr:hypothetical protein [Muribaculaceae bacterium]
MTTLVVGLIFAIICILYGWASFAYRQKDHVIEVEAGNTDDGCKLGKYDMSSKSVRLSNGKYVNTRDFIRIIIHGNCMTPRNILNGEEWLVEPINQKLDIKSQLRIKDVVLLFIEDKNSYIIRELSSFDTDGTLQTSRYNDDKSIRASKRNHRLDQILGVVRYAI